MKICKNNKLRLESSSGNKGEFSKEMLSIPVSLDRFELITKYDLSKSSEDITQKYIRVRSIDLDLFEFIQEYQDDVLHDDFDLSDEIECEFKVLSEKDVIDRVKTNDSLLTVLIIPATAEVKSHVMLERQGFTVVTFHMVLPENIFDDLAEAIKCGTLKEVHTIIEINGFNLGYELGRGKSGVLFENGQVFEFSNLSTTLTNPKDSILDALSRIDRRVEKIGTSSSENIT